MKTKMQELLLHIGERTTPVLVGSGLWKGMKDIRSDKIILMVDEHVLALHKSKFLGFEVIPVLSGEKHKSLGDVLDLQRQLVDLEADRSTFIVGVGGGLVTDVVGFVASTYMRGIRFGFISTTLLGQVDASIGGKNGVNLDGYKNMVGVINQPEFVWCDLSFLSTLETGEYLSGYAEVIKYGAIRDKDFLNFLEKNGDAVMSRNDSVMEKIISHSASMKIEIVASDVDEKGDRKLLNFGHTFGHAIEKITGVLHGYAISIGMCMAARLSERLGLLGEEESVRLRSTLEAAGLPVTTDIQPDMIFNTLLKDKKRSGSQIHFILLRELGNAYIHTFKLDELRRLTNDLY